MTKYIDLEAAIACVKYGTGVAWEIVSELKKIPVADVKPVVRGKWLNEELVPDNITGHIEAECSVCHVVRIVDNFCPSCGAEMEVGNG